MSANPASKRDHQTVFELPAIDSRRLPGVRAARRAVTFALVSTLTLILAMGVSGFWLWIDVTVGAVGQIEPASIWPVRARTSGVVADVLVRSGEPVRVGQPLIRLDTATEGAASVELNMQLASELLERQRLSRTIPIERAQALVSESQAEAALLRSRAVLLQRMVEFGFGSNVDSVLRTYRRGTHVVLDQAIADVVGAEAARETARIQLERATLVGVEVEKQTAAVRRLTAQLASQRTGIDRAVLSAPSSGTVLTDRIERLRDAAVHPGDILLEIADTHGWRAALSVSERDVYRIRVGDRALVEIPALAALRLEPLLARVTAIAGEPSSSMPGGTLQGVAVSPPPSIVSSSDGYRVLVTLDSASIDSLGAGLIRRGFAVQAKIVTRRMHVYELFREWARKQIHGG